MQRKIKNTLNTAERHQTPGLALCDVSPGVDLSYQPKHKLRVLPIGLLNEYRDDKPVMKALTLAFAIKSRFRSSAVVRTSYKKIASMFHIGRERAKKSITILAEMGLIDRKGESIVFRSFRHAGDYKFIDIQDYKNIDLTNLQEVEKFIRLQAVYIKQAQIDYAANRLSELSDPKNMRELKRARRYMRKHNWGGKADHGQSIRTVGEVSGLSKTTAVELLKWGISRGLLVKEKRITRVGFYRTKEEALTKGQGYSEFFCHGRRYLAETSILHFK